MLQSYIVKAPGAGYPRIQNPVYILNAQDTADLLDEDFSGEKYNDMCPLNESSRYRINAEQAQYMFAESTGNKHEYTVQVVFRIDEIDADHAIKKHRDELYTFTVFITNNEYKIVRSNTIKNLAVITISAITAALLYVMYDTLRG